MTMVFSELGNLLLKNCATFIFEQSALSELLGCFRNFTRQPAKLTFISRQYIGVLIKLAKMPPNEKIQKQACQCLANLMRLPDLAKYVIQTGGTDLQALIKQTES
jgi:hypothetical protein